MPLASKALGRDDETYLIQVAIKLGLVETHFALYSSVDVIELNHLQIGIKLRLTEVDSLYAATYQDAEGVKRQLIITVEAKKRRQRILPEQIVRQVKAAFNAALVDLVVPMASAKWGHLRRGVAPIRGKGTNLSRRLSSQSKFFTSSSHP
ncbi:hypothetical protein [Granulicella aggregans]|nr:hypothetical protein [Granulicella aggregans]